MKKTDVQKRASEVAAECLGYRTRSLNRTVTRIYDEALRPVGITIGQFTILAALVARGPVLAADLGHRLNLEKSTLSRNLGLMQAKGWVRREPLEDESRWELDSTARGRRIFASALPQWEKAQERALKRLGSRMAGSLLRLFATS